MCSGGYAQDLKGLHIKYFLSTASCLVGMLILILIYLLPAIALTPGGSSTVDIYTQTIHRTTQLTTLVGRPFGNSAGRAPSLQVIPRHLPYN